MRLCIPYRYYVAILTSLGLFLLTSLRYIFVLIVTHTNQVDEPIPDNGTSAAEPERSTSIFPHCPTTNTSNDFRSHFPKEVSIQFHTTFYVGNIFGLILTTFYFSGFPPHIVLSIGAVLSGLIALIIPPVFVAGSAIGILFLRFCHGVGLSVMRPTIVSIMALWAPSSEKATLMSLALFGGIVAPSASNFVTGVMICFVSWHSSLFLYGGLGFLWSVIWFSTYYPDPKSCPCVKPEEIEKLGYQDIKDSKLSKRRKMSNVPWKEIFTSKPLWSIWLCQVSKSWVLSTLTDLQPQFFNDIYHIRAADLGLLLSVQPLSCAILMSLAARVADKIIIWGGWTTTRVRKLTQAVGGFVEAISMISAAFAPSWFVAYICFLFAFSFDGVGTIGIRCNGAELSPRYSMTLTSIILTGNIGGVMNTFLASHLAGEHSTRFNWGITFLLGGGVSILATVTYLIFASAEVQPWDKSQDQELQLVATNDHREKYALISDNSTDSSDEEAAQKSKRTRSNSFRLSEGDYDSLD